MADLSGAYAEARGRLVELLEGLDESRLATRVPACPDWTVRDVLAHVTGVAADAAQERFFLGATDAWRGGDLGEERDAWTEAQVGSRRGRSVAELAAEWAGWASSVESVLAGTVQLPAGAPDWLRTAPLDDLAGHRQDCREALRRARDRDAPITRLGLRIYARWLGQRLDQTGRPALLLRTGDREWVEGAGAPEAVLAAEPFELFRALSGRRSAAQVRALGWDGEPERYLEVFAPYPMPSSPLRE